MTTMKKIIRENIYETLIVCFIILVIIIYCTIRFLYPIWVFNTLMKVEPGYLLLNEKLGRGTFGDMYGALNTFFSGLAFAGLLVSIFLQIHIHKKEQQIEKEVRIKEEKYLLRYLAYILSKCAGYMQKANDEVLKYSEKNTTILTNQRRIINTDTNQIDKLFSQIDHERYLVVL